MGTLTTVVIRKAGPSKPMPLPKALTSLNRRVAYAKLMGNMKDLSENLAEDERSLIMAEVLYNFTGTLSKSLLSRRIVGAAGEVGNLPAMLPQIFESSMKIAFGMHTEADKIVDEESLVLGNQKISAGNGT